MEDFEGKTAVSGYVVGELCEHPSNFRCQYELNKFLVDNNICGISGVDTRQITRTIREQGVMNAMICSSDVSALRNPPSARCAIKSSASPSNSTSSAMQMAPKRETIDSGAMRRKSNRWQRE